MITLIIITTIWLFVTFCVCLELIRSLLHSIHPTWSPARSRDNRIVGILLKDRWHYLLLFILKMDIICLIISTVQWKSIQGLLISSVLCASQNWKLKQTLIKHNKVHIVRSWWSWVLRSYSIHTCCNSLKDERSHLHKPKKRRIAFFLCVDYFVSKMFVMLSNHQYKKVISPIDLNG